MADKPEALRLADELDRSASQTDHEDSVIDVARWFVEDAAAELRRLAGVEAERDALRADAERYQWLREKNGVAVDVVVFGTTHGDLDAAIDAAKGGGNG